MEVKVIVKGDKNKEHFTYVENNGVYFQFYDNGYEGIPCEQVIALLKFLGHEVFVVYQNKLKDDLPCVNWKDFI